MLGASNSNGVPVYVAVTRPGKFRIRVEDFAPFEEQASGLDILLPITYYP
jgi:hypothetical protein